MLRSLWGKYYSCNCFDHFGWRFNGKRVCFLNNLHLDCSWSLDHSRSWCSPSSCKPSLSYCNIHQGRHLWGNG
ncbi:hypothetical protein AQUCO_01800123v1 [Aquilegia coerulea]|uniref:Uncharacterized protein n=1 Tax=Aquilegia coerulea TaxID=218851 RepID=A0A2G5DK55_AQUCA|nr:hypothetical protein AQUCO_01800123v1 [Aquilegia coerulea]